MMQVVSFHASSPDYFLFTSSFARKILQLLQNIARKNAGEKGSSQFIPFAEIRISLTHETVFLILCRAKKISHQRQ